jgi:hypothetical protein
METKNKIKWQVNYFRTKKTAGSVSSNPLWNSNRESWPKQEEGKKLLRFLKIINIQIFRSTNVLVQASTESSDEEGYVLVQPSSKSSCGDVFVQASLKQSHDSNVLVQQSLELNSGDDDAQKSSESSHNSNELDRQSPGPSRNPADLHENPGSLYQFAPNILSRPSLEPSRDDTRNEEADQLLERGKVAMYAEAYPEALEIFTKAIKAEKAGRKDPWLLAILMKDKADCCRHSGK